MAHSLTAKVILITGASAGIGAALARALSEQFQGVRLVLAARNQAKLETVAAHCQGAGAEVLVIVTDLEQPDQAIALAEKTLHHFGQIDVLVNNAGYGQMGPLELVPISACRRQFAVNLLGPLALTQAVIPHMRDRGGGRIINVSSLGGRLAFPIGGLYSASKFALEAISDVLRMELEPFNIKVSVVEPGPVSTEFISVAGAQTKQEIPDPEATPYHAALQKLEHLEQQTSSNAWTSERVADVIIKVIAADHPRPRYVAATGGDFLLFMMRRVLPTRLVDRFWQRFYGIDLVARQWKGKDKELKQKGL